jgi:hypothetical protein
MSRASHSSSVSGLADANTALSTFSETLLAPAPAEYDTHSDAGYHLGRLPCANCVGAQLRLPGVVCVPQGGGNACITCKQDGRGCFEVGALFPIPPPGWFVREPSLTGRRSPRLFGAGDRALQLLLFNEESLVSASHQLALITSLPFVHTARRGGLRWRRVEGTYRGCERCEKKDGCRYSETQHFFLGVLMRRFQMERL